MRIVSINVHYQDGLGYQDYYLGKELRNLGHEVYFISSDTHFRFPDYENTVQPIIGPRYVGDGIFLNNYGCEVHRLKSTLIGRWYYLHGFKKKIKELKPDLIIAHGVFNFQSIKLGIWGQKLSCQIIFDDHTTLGFYRNNLFSKFIYKLFRVFFAAKIQSVAKKIVGISDTCIPTLEKIYGLAGDKIQMIPLGTDTEIFHCDPEIRNSFRHDLGLKENDFLVVYTGKILPQKRIHSIIDALNEISPTSSAKIVFLLVGNASNDYQIMINDRISQFKHQLIRMPAVDQNTLAKIYNAADVGVWLDYSNSTCDASACGCPVIVTNLMPERVKGNGFLVDRDDVEQLRTAITQLFSSNSLREKMRDASLLLIKNELSWKVHAHKFIN